MRASSTRRSAAIALAVLMLAALPALVTIATVSASGRGADPGTALGEEAPTSPFALLLERLGSAREGHADREPSRRLQSVSTVPRSPRLADQAVVDGDRQRRNPRLRVDAPAEDALSAVRGTDGVWGAAQYRLADLPVEGERGRDLRVGFVDPAFRTFTPILTARSDTLWRGLEAGEAILTFATAHHLGVGPGEEITVEGERFRVAGVATLAPADVADVLLSSATLNDLGLETEHRILVGLDRLKERGEVRQRLLDAGVGEVREIDPSDGPYRAELVGDEELVGEFEPFTFRHRGGGLFDIDPVWIDAHIERTAVPVLGEVMCHRLIIPQMRAALEEIVERELDHLLDPDDYGGCWVPRHIGFDESRPLSMHAWGTAFDVNVHTNLYGDPPQLDERIVEVFDRHGFDWGGDWKTPDGMHFELRELQDPPD